MKLPILEYKKGDKIETGKYYLNMPNETYHSTSGDSKSSLDVFHQDPYKYFHRKKKNKREQWN